MSSDKKQLKIIFEFSRFIDYLFLPSPTGIARVDLEYANHIIENPPLFAAGLHEYFGISTRFTLRTLRRLVRIVEHEWDRNPGVNALEATVDWLGGLDPERRRVGHSGSKRREFLRKAGRLSINWPYHNTIFAKLPHRAIYINTSYARIHRSEAFRWLEKRQDIACVFMVHDLLPLSAPGYFWDGADEKFLKQISNIIRFADLVVTPSETVKNELTELSAMLGRSDIRIEHIHLPPAKEFLARPRALNGLKGRKFFVVCGTLEPRKNHLFLFDVWKQLVHRYGDRAPALLVVGGRGWKNAAILDRLENAPELAGHVLEVSNLSTEALRDLIHASCGLLQPSFAEGYGMPVVEALSIGTPVIANDIPVFREVSKGLATLLPVDDPDRWTRLIMELADGGPLAEAATTKATSFVPPTWDGYFASLFECLSGIQSHRLKS